MNYKDLSDKAYVVVAIEQDRRSEWSRHGRLDLAMAAARRYRRRNADTGGCVDHYGYDIVLDGRIVDTVR